MSVLPGALPPARAIPPAVFPAGFPAVFATAFGPRPEALRMTAAGPRARRARHGRAPRPNPPPAAPTQAHEPVMVARVLHHLAPRPGGRYLDATFGRGGHSRALLEAAARAGRPDDPPATLLALDRDPAAEPAAAETAAEHPGFRFLRRDFAELDAALADAAPADAAPAAPNAPGAPQLDGILLDLGVSSPQLDAPESDAAAPGRGFSFLRDEPLDMRFDPDSGGETAAELLDRLEEPEIADLLHAAGERRSRAIARRIAARRPIETTGDLRAAVVAAIGPKRTRLDPATRTFLAVRRAVNREAESLAAALDKAPALLAPGGALVVLAYHSDEDRPVKHRFRELAAAGAFTVETRRPERPDEDERAGNPRSRSARLRALRRAPEAPPEAPPEPPTPPR